MDLEVHSRNVFKATNSLELESREHGFAWLRATLCIYARTTIHFNAHFMNFNETFVISHCLRKFIFLCASKVEGVR